MTAAGRACDCLNDCGDDPGLKTGLARPCAGLLKARARKVPGALKVKRYSQNRHQVIVTYRDPLTDDQLKAVRDKLLTGGFQ